MKRFGIVSGLAAICMGVGTVAAVAATTVVVTPTNTQGWSTADTRTGGAVNFVVDATAPSGFGALQLTTDNTNDAKAQYMHGTHTPLASVTELSYYTKQVAPPGVADPSYQLPVNLDPTSDTSSSTTLVFEPYWNPPQAVIADTWQQWNVADGLFWSSKTVTCTGGTIVAHPGGPATYTLQQVRDLCPSAVVTGFGVNIGTYNPDYNVEADLVNFNGTVYDFEPYSAAKSKDDCKKGGWENQRRSDGSTFRNQGDCIQYVNTGK